MGKNIISVSGATELRKELEYLRNVRQHEVASLIKEALAFGDISENSEYEDAMAENSKMLQRMARINEVLNNSIVVDDSEGSSDGKIIVGSKVVLLLNGDLEMHLTVVGNNEGNMAENRISMNSPIGKAIYGRSKGAEAEFIAGNGNKSKVRVLEVA